MRRIIKNVARCNLCGDVIESRDRHELVWCKCHSIYVDGGHDYLRRGFVNSPDDITDMSKYVDEE